MVSLQLPLLRAAGAAADVACYCLLLLLLLLLHASNVSGLVLLSSPLLCAAVCCECGMSPHHPAAPSPLGQQQRHSQGAEAKQVEQERLPCSGTVALRTHAGRQSTAWGQARSSNAQDTLPWLSHSLQDCLVWLCCPVHMHSEDHWRSKPHGTCRIDGGESVPIMLVASCVSPTTTKTCCWLLQVPAACWE